MVGSCNKRCRSFPVGSIKRGGGGVVLSSIFGEKFLSWGRFCINML